MDHIGIVGSRRRCGDPFFGERTEIMLNNVVLRNLKSGSVSDGTGLGLICRVLPSGKKQFICRKFTGGHRYFKTLGFYPALSLADARRMAQEFVRTLTPEDGSAAITFKALFDKWWAVKQTSVKDHKNIVSRMNRILDVFGGRAFTSVTTLEMTRFFDKYTAGGTKSLEAARRAAIYLKQMETYAVNTGYAGSYRFQGITQAIARKRVEHFPSVPPADLPEILQKLKDETRQSPSVLPVIKMALYTLLRPSEYCLMRWDWISDEAISVPSEIMKMKRPHRVPLTPQIRALLDQLRPFRTGSDAWVFPSPQSPFGGHVGIGMCERFFSKHGFKGVLVPHGIRSIGRTWMAENNVPLDVAELSLAHVFGSSTQQAYNRSDLFDQRKAVLEQWDAYVEQCFNAPRIKGQGRYFVFA